MSPSRTIPRCPEFNSTYHQKCRCDFCRKTAARLRREQRYRTAARSWNVTHATDIVDGTEAYELVLRAVSHGTSDGELSRITGVSTHTFGKLRRTGPKPIQRSTHDLIVRALRDNTDLRSFTRGKRVPANYTITMIHALSAQGWTHEKLREILRTNLDTSGAFINTVTYRKTDHVYYESDMAIRWLVAQIGDTRGPSNRAALMARTRGYFPTKHYDVEGNLVVKSLPKEVRQSIEGV